MRGDCMRAAAQEKEIICFYKIIIVTVLKNAGIAFPRFFFYIRLFAVVIREILIVMP